MKELKVKVWNYKNVVLFEVLEQDESLREKEIIFEASNGYEIVSVFCPCLHSDNICIRGSQKRYDNAVSSFECENIEEAKETVKKVKQAVAEYNESIKEILTDKEKEYINKVIEPFKNQISSISKVKYDDEKRYLVISYDDIGWETSDSLDFPFFLNDKYYKGMKLDMEYTLKDLGLE